MKIITAAIIFSVLLNFNTSFSQYGWFTQNSGTPVKLNDISVVYPYSYAWIAGDNGVILFTGNGGNNWTQQNSGTTNNINSLHFVNTFKGFACGNNGTVLRTVNGGINWLILTTGTGSDLYSISFDHYVWSDSVFTLWAAGKNGTIIKTTNFGNNWFIQNSGTLNDLRAIYQYDYGVLWIAGAGGTILSTSNSGNTWHALNTGTIVQLNSVESIYGGGYMFGGLAAGKGGLIIRSINLGTNWAPVASGTNADLNSLAPQYLPFVWACGGNGTLLKSTDVGITWDHEIIPTSNNLNSIHFSDVNSGWAVGDNGTIIRTVSDNYYIDSKRMDANTIGAWYANNGTFNNTYPQGGLNAGFEWPRGQNKYARFSSGLWIGAAVGADTFVTIAQYSDFQYVPGYTDNNGVGHGSNDPEYRMYKLKYGLNDLDRQHWPNALLGNSNQGAPVYFDTLANSWKPLDFGEQTMFYSYTDNYDLLHSDFTPPLKADIKQLNYAFNVTGAMANTIYSQYTIINRSSQQWNSTYITFWTDDDLGDPFDDKTGCDTVLDIGFTYNGDNFDTSYGADPPAVSFNLVKGPIVFTGNNNDTAFICKGKTKIVKVGYRQAGMSVFNIYAYGADPTYPMDFYHYMEGFDINGGPLINPVTGKRTKFVFSGDPETNTGWIQNNMTDMRFLISVGPITMNPGDTQIIVIAQVVARGTSNVNSVTLLKQYAQVVKQNYENCFSNVPIGITNNSNQVPLRFSLSQNYPNPFNPATIIKYQLPISNEVNLVIFDALGREVRTLVNEKQNAGTYQVKFDGTDYSSGVYFYKLSATGGAETFSETKKMVLIK